MLQLESSLMSPTDMSCSNVADAVYLLVSCALALSIRLISAIVVHICSLRREIDSVFLVLGLRKLFPLVLGRSC